MKKEKQNYILILLFICLATNLKAKEEKKEGVITFTSGSYIKAKNHERKIPGIKKEAFPLKEVYIWHDGNEIVNTQKYTLEENTETTTARNHGLRARAKDTIAINEKKMIITPIQEKILDNSANIMEGEFKNHVFGALAYDSATIINEGEIELTSNNPNTGTQQAGMGAFTGAQVINNGKITGSANVGMYADKENSLAINNGTISHIGPNGMVANGNRSSIINNNIISNTGENGMIAKDGAIAINTEKGIVENKKITTDNSSGKKGMVADGKNSEIYNYGIIQNEDNTGVYIINGATGYNFNIIQNIGMGGMIANGIGSEAINHGIIQNKNKYGMKAENGAIVINKKEGTIKNEGINGMYAIGVGSTAINYGAIENTGKNAMAATSGGEAYNYATLTNGILYATDNGTVVNGKEGKIINSKNSSFIIKTTGIGINNGIIESNFTTTDDGTIKISQGGYFINKELASINSTGKAIYIGADAATEESAVMINEGTITTSGDNAYAVYAKDNSIAINKNTINVTGNNSYGMYATNGATIVNEGTINITGNNSYGMYATGEGSKIENKGSIILANNSVIVGNQENKMDTQGNTAIKLYNGATFVNSGEFKVEGNLDFSELGDGKFEISQGGTIEANSIKGNFYASGALTLGSYEDIYSTYKVLKTDKIDGEVKSNSAMFTSKLTEKNENGYYDIIMERKNFNDLLNNSSIATTLENSYIQGDSNSKKDTLFDALKLLSTKQDLNNATDMIYGNKIYPVIRQQSFDFIKLNNDKIKSNVLSQTNITGDIRYIGGMDYSIMDQDSSNSFNGYITKANGIYLGIDKNIDESYRIGGVINITDINSNFTNNDRREDRMYQGTIYGIYDKNNTNLTSTLFLGKLDGKLNRRISFSNINENMKGDINNHYFGFTNQLEHKFDLKHFYIKPKIEANLIVLYQKEVDEDGEYGLNIQKESNRSFETGIGFDIGKDFKFNNGIKVSLNQGIEYNYEFADTTKAVDTQLKDVISDRVKLSEYDKEKSSTELITKIEITKNDFGVYGEYKYTMGKNQDKQITTLGLTYKF